MPPPYVAPNEIIASAWGNAVVDELARKLDTINGGTVLNHLYADNAPVSFGSAAGEQLRILSYAAQTTRIGFYRNAADIATLGTRSGRIGYDAGDTDLIVENEVGAGQVQLRSAAEVAFYTAGSEVARFTGQQMLIGKATQNINTAGLEVAGGGSILVTRAGTGGGTAIPVRTNLNGAANTDGSAHVNFLHAGVSVAAITRATSTTVAYQTGSDERIKTRSGDADDTFERIRRLAAKGFRGQYHDAVVDGQPYGHDRVMLYAHDIADEFPEVVQGERGAVDDEGNPVLQMVGFADLVPALVVALGNTLDRIDALEQAAG